MISERAGQPSPGWTDESDPVTGTWGIDHAATLIRGGPMRATRSRASAFATRFEAWSKA